MIDLYTFNTGNGWRASIALEECGLPYTAHKIDISQGEQNAAAFRRINPLGMIPVIVDSDGPQGKAITITQSGAILLYCAEKSGRFLPSNPIERLITMEWLMLAVSDGSDVIGGIIRMLRVASEAGVELYKGRLQRLLEAADAHLAEREYLASEISVADLALYPIAAYAKQFVGIDSRSHLKRWYNALSQRPGVVKGMAVAT